MILDDLRDAIAGADSQETSDGTSSANWFCTSVRGAGAALFCGVASTSAESHARGFLGPTCCCTLGDVATFPLFSLSSSGGAGIAPRECSIGLSQRSMPLGF